MRSFIFQFNNPESRFHVPHWPTFTQKWSKIVTATAAIVIGLSLAVIISSTVVSNNKKFKVSHNIGTSASDIKETDATKSDAALPGSSTVSGIGGTSGTNSPVVTLTATPGTVMKGQKAKLKWTATNNPKSCVATEDWTGDKSTGGGEVDTQSLTTVQNYLFTLTCKTDTGTGFATVSVSVMEPATVSGNAALSPNISIAAERSYIFVGDTTTISWSVSNSPTSCTASGSWSGLKTSTGSYVTPTYTKAGDYSYVLACSNSAGTATSSPVVVTVVDVPPGTPVVFMTQNVTQVTPGTSVTFTWTSTDTVSCTAGTDWSGIKGTSGSFTTGALNTIKQYQYLLTCYNSAGASGYDLVAIDVLPNPPSLSLTSSAATIYVGNTVTLNWSASNNPTGCTASGNWTGSITPTSSGSSVRGPFNTPTTLTFGLICTNQGGDSGVKVVTVSVVNPPVPVVTLTPSAATVTVNGTVSLTWTASNSPTSCTGGSDFAGAKSPPSGGVSTVTVTQVRTYTFTLMCANAGGNSTQVSRTVNVIAGGGAVIAPTISFTATPTTVGTGDTVTVGWTVQNNPTSCTASGATGWSGSLGAAGTSSYVPAAAGTYTLRIDCSNSAGSAFATQTVTVIAKPVVTLTFNPTSITTAGSTTLTWTATNSPTTCTASGTGFTGSKAANSSQVIAGSSFTSANTYTYQLTCTNAGGSTTGTTSLVVTIASVVYCGGLTPCYGVSTLAAHAAVAATNAAAPTSCWAYIAAAANTSLYDMGAFAKSHSGGNNTVNKTSVCGKSALADLNAAPSNSKHSSAKNNTQSTLNTFRVGYYDATKP